MSGPSVERSVQVNGTPLRYLEAGQGSPVVILGQKVNDDDHLIRKRSSFTFQTGELELSPFATLLARQFRVVVLEVPALPSPEQAKLARRLNQAATALGLDHYVVIGSSATAAVALWQAIDAPDHIGGLVLISPTVLLPDASAESALLGRLEEVRAATFVLFGTNDTAIPPEAGRLYAERLSDCYYALTYDAGHDIAGERPEALSEAVSDFVERRGTFIVERNNTALNP